MASLRGSLGESALTVGVVNRGAFVNPLLKLRLQRAGIERVVDSSEVTSVDDMHRVVSDVAASVATVPADVDLLGAGVGRGADPDAVVSWVLDRLAGPLGAEYRNAFDPRFTQAACGLSRRQAFTVRARLAGLGRIHPNLSCSGGGPVRDRSVPRWTDVINVANLCRGLECMPLNGHEAESVDDAEAAPWRAA